MALCNTFEGFGLRFHVLIRGETPSGPLSKVAISPREGSDQFPVHSLILHHIFIHAPREGSDEPRSACRGCHGYFYPRSPRGERPAGTSCRAQRPKFLSTLPARGATWRRRCTATGRSNFYPRSPRGERPGHRRSPPLRTYFYPRSPRGERPAAGDGCLHLPHFYPRSPRGERPTRPCAGRSTTHFYPRSPRGERPRRLHGRRPPR